MDVYWQILELEQDDLQAYQFREYVEDVSVFDYSFLLRFERQPLTRLIEKRPGGAHCFCVNKPFCAKEEVNLDVTPT